MFTTSPIPVNELINQERLSFFRLSENERLSDHLRSVIVQLGNLYKYLSILSF